MRMYACMYICMYIYTGKMLLNASVNFENNEGISLSLSLCARDHFLPAGHFKHVAIEAAVGLIE